MGGYSELTLQLYDTQTLKDKRAVRQSVIRRVQNTHRVAIAEIERTDSHRLLVLGVAAVSNEESHLHQILDTVERFILAHVNGDYVERKRSVMTI